jgi:hypothetical protein
MLQLQIKDYLYSIGEGLYSRRDCSVLKGLKI